jgi:cytoskeleton protein RodZ
MESLGKYLKDARSKLNISLGQIANDTNIAKKYLESLENEDYSIFPSETYLKGFLKSYCEYLKLNSNEVLKKYETIKIAESQVPLEKLIPKRKFNLRPLITIGSFVLILIFIIGITTIITKTIKNINKNNILSDKKNKDSKQPVTYTYKKDDPEQVLNLKKGDIIEYVMDNEKYKLAIKELTPVVKILTNASTNSEIILIKSFPVKIDVNNDNTVELNLYLNQWDSDKANIIISSKEINPNQSVENKISLEGENPQVLTKLVQKSRIDFTVDVNGPAFFRYKIDDNPEVEKFYTDKYNNNFSAVEKVILWTSNAGNVSINFQNFNKTLKLGEIGDIAVKLIKYKQNANNEYELEISNLN